MWDENYLGVSDDDEVGGVCAMLKAALCFASSILLIVHNLLLSVHSCSDSPRYLSHSPANLPECIHHPTASAAKAASRSKSRMVKRRRMENYLPAKTDNRRGRSLP